MGAKGRPVGLSRSLSDKVLMPAMEAWRTWAMRDSHSLNINGEKQGVCNQSAAKSAVNPNHFTEAIMSIMRLPLSDAEKAEAVRLLLRGDMGDGGRKP